MTTNARIVETVKQVVQWLADKDYEALVKHTRGVRLDEKMIASSIARYGRTIVVPAEEDAWDAIDVVQITGAIPRAWSVHFDLWTREDGRSDLTVELTLFESTETLMDIRLEDIRVL